MEAGSPDGCGARGDAGRLLRGILHPEGRDGLRKHLVRP